MVCSLFLLGFSLFFHGVSWFFQRTGFQRTGYPLIFIDGYPSMNIIEFIDGYPSMNINEFIDGYPSMNINGYPSMIWSLPLGPMGPYGLELAPRGHIVGALCLELGLCSTVVG